MQRQKHLKFYNAWSMFFPTLLLHKSADPCPCPQIPSSLTWDLSYPSTYCGKGESTTSHAFPSVSSRCA